MRIAIIGPQNTGKSTFAEDFIKNFPEYISPEETYRDVINKHELDINQKTSEHSQKLIRDFLYEQILTFPGKSVVFDRCVIDNYVYTRAQYDRGEIGQGFLDETVKLMYGSLKNLDAVIFIPTAVSVALKNDGVRDIDTIFVDKVNKLFLDILFEIVRKTGLRVVTVTGSRKDRIEQAREFINQSQVGTTT